MESSMSLSSLSFEEDEFDNSTDNEIRFVDIEKEILSKKTNDSDDITNAPKYAQTGSEKENVHHKMLHIANLGLRPKYSSEGKMYAIKSQDSRSASNKNIAKTNTAPVKHFAYRTSKPTTKQHTSPLITQDNVKQSQSGSTKVKYFATRSNVNSKKLEQDKFVSVNDLQDPLDSNVETGNVVQSKPKEDDATNINPSCATSGLESDNERTVPEIPNLNSIEIIDESGNEDDVPTDTAMDIEDEIDYDENEESISVLKPEFKKKVPQFAIRTNKSTSEPKNKYVKLPVTSNSKPVATRTVPKHTKQKLKGTTTRNIPFRTIAPKIVGDAQVSSVPSSTKKSIGEHTPSKSDDHSRTSSAAVDAGTNSSTKPIAGTSNVSSTVAPVTMPARSMVVHSSMPALSNTNLSGMTSMTQSLNFVVAKEDIIKYKLSNTPLILSVPPLVSADGSQITPTTGRSLLMILPQQLPSNLNGPGVVNFLVTNPHFKPNVSVQIPTNAPPKMPTLTPLKNTPGSSSNRSLLLTQQKTKKASEVASSTEDVKMLNTKEKDGPNWCWYLPRFGKRDLEGFLYKDRLGFSRTETDKARKCLRKLNVIVYRKQCELDDIASNIIKLKRGIKPSPPSALVGKSAGPIDKPNILRRKRQLSNQKSLLYTNENLSQKGSIVNYGQLNETDGTNQIKIVSVASLSEQNEDSSFLLGEEQTDSPVMPIDDQSGDDCSSDLYYTKKVVILRNRNPNLPKRKTRRMTRLPKIRLRQNRLAVQSNLKPKLKPVLPPVKKCSVVLNRDEALEKVIREKFDIRSRRKRKLDLESMGLIKKVRRRNAIDTPPDNEIIKTSKVENKSLKSETNLIVSSGFRDMHESPVRTSPKLKVLHDKLANLAHGHGHPKSSSKTICEPKIKSSAEGNYLMTNDFDQDELASSSSSSLKIVSEKTFDLTSGHKKNAHDYKKSFFMSYRERQKISSLTHAERRFIFALNTIHSLEDLRLDDKKPLLVLDQHNTERDLLSVRFNFKFDFESMNNYNVVFTRDDDEALPLALLKNLKLVYLVRHGHIKVVSRPVLCKYLLEKCNLVKKPIEKMQMKELHSKNKDDVKKAMEVEKPRYRMDVKDDFKKKRTVNVRSDLMPTKSIVPSSSTRDDSKQQKSREVKTVAKSSLQVLDKRRLYPKPEKKPASLIKTNLKHKSDSLDTKFNEIEKNLSMMFEKAKPSTSEVFIAKQCEVAKDSLKDAFENVDCIKDVEIASSEAADLDYLFTNSGDENSNLGKEKKKGTTTVAEEINKTELSHKLELNKSSEKSRAAVPTKEDKDGTVETLEELLTSPGTDSGQVHEVDHRRYASNSSSVDICEHSKFTVDPSTECPETSTVNENVELSLLESPSSTNIQNNEQETVVDITKQNDKSNSNNEDFLVQMMPIPVAEDDHLMNTVADAETASKIQVEVSNKENEDSLIVGHAESDDIGEELQSGNEQDTIPHKKGTCIEKRKYENPEDLDIEQFLAKSGVKLSSCTNENEFLSEKTDDTSTKDIALSQVSDNQDVAKHSKEQTLPSEMEVQEEPIEISETDSNADNTFTDTLAQQNVSVETDPVIPQDENLLYLIPEKAGDAASIPADTSSDVSIEPLQISSTNMDDVEDASKMSYTVPSFETTEDLNEQVTENLMTSGSFELFNNASDKVGDESTAIGSRNLTFEDDTNDPESTMIMLDAKKTSGADLLSSCEIDTDIAMCSDGISKNLPDDYLEK